MILLCRSSGIFQRDMVLQSGKGMQGGRSQAVPDHTGVIHSPTGFIQRRDDGNDPPDATVETLGLSRGGRLKMPSRVQAFNHSVALCEGWPLFHGLGAGAIIG